MASGALLLCLTSVSLGATRSATLEPTQGPVGAHVHIAIVDTGAHEPQRDLVMRRCHLTACDDFDWQYSCIAEAETYPVGTIAWTGSSGTADFEVPDIPLGDYYLFEVLGGVIPPCMPVGAFSVLSLDTAMAQPRGVSLISLVGFVLIGLAGFMAVARLRGWTWRSNQR